MCERFLFGPVSGEFSRENLQKYREIRQCITFDEAGTSDLPIRPTETWEQVSKRLPSTWKPDCLFVHLQYRTTPACLFSAPVPVVGLAGDWNLLWHYYRRQLQQLDFVLTDVVGAETMARQGIHHVRSANIFGGEMRFISRIPPECERDIDILFVGNLHPAVQRECLAWLGRIARLSQRWNVVITTGVFGEEYERLLSRTRIVFNRSIRKEWNNRTSEALAAGALLFQESDNREVPACLADRKECVFYTSENLETLLTYYLEHEEERKALAAAGQQRAAEFTFESLWAKHLDLIQGEWEELVARARARIATRAAPDLIARTWQTYCSSFGNDPTLIGDLRRELEVRPASASLQNALGIVLAFRKSAKLDTLPTEIAEAFRAAWAVDPTHYVSGLNLAETLAEGPDRAEAIGHCRRVLDALEKAESLDPESLDAPHYPPAFDYFRVEWERAAWKNAGCPEKEAEAKGTLLRWRLHLLLGDLTGDIAHFQEAARARPDLPLSQGALGCALGRHHRFKEAVVPLSRAIEANPFDRDAARALYHVLGAIGSVEDQSKLAGDRRLLAKAAPQTILSEPWFSEQPARLPARFTSITPEAFQREFGVVNIARAIYGFTKPIDTQVVLTLLAHARPERILEIGTASGHMTANLTEWSPENATVFSLGVVADLGIATSPDQRSEDPPRSEFGRFANHFGKAHKACFITADSLKYDMRRLAPIDFVFIDGSHDLQHVLSDSRRAYDILRPGGYILWHDFGSPMPWVKVREALEQLSFQEPIYHVAETEVAYLRKTGQAEPQEASEESARPVERLAILWEGDQKALHSLAHVNRQMCLGLIQRGHEVSILPDTHTGFETAVSPLLVNRFNHPLSGPVGVHIRQQWPPKLEPPPAGHWVFLQPWEFGSVPKAWVDALKAQVDEIWAYTRFVRDCYIESGISPDLVHVVPLGVDLEIFHPYRPPLQLNTKKRFRFLFVGGTIYRKGIDLLLDAYTRTFRRSDDVCLVIKDMGGRSFYQGQTAQRRITQIKNQADSPEIEYIDRLLTEEEIARLYTACNVLVHPYRGEGFGLPIAEAMASELPVIVTGAGAALDFCNEHNAYLIAAEKTFLNEKRISNLETVAVPWLFEASLQHLCQLMRHVVQQPEEARAKGRTGREHIARYFTWEHAVDAAQARLRALAKKPIRRISRDGHLTSEASTVWIAASRPTVSLSMIVKNEEKNLPACLESVEELFSEIIVVDTGSEDRTRDIAKQFGARVFDFPWIDSFAAARNESLRHATGDWVFWMDADDRLDAENRRVLRKLLGNLPNENVAYVMKCLCLPDPETGSATVVDHVRLFRNGPNIHWEYRVHEQILPSIRISGGSLRWTDVVIHHVGYQDKSIRKKKLERDIRLLTLENQEHPNEPFVLFNLGSVYQEQGKHAKAIEILRRSLEGSHPTDSIVRKLYALLAQSHRQLGQKEQAVSVCKEGRTMYPDDPELLFQEGLALRETGDRPEAESRFLTLLNKKERKHFGSVDTGILGYKTRHNLAIVYYEEKKYAEAESQWRAALTESADFIPAWLGLGDIFLAQARWGEVDELVSRLEKHPQGCIDAELLRARSLLCREEYRLAKKRLQHLIERSPKTLGPRIVLSHVLLREGRDLKAAEKALRDVLALDPNHAEARHNLDVLLQGQKRASASV